MSKDIGEQIEVLGTVGDVLEIHHAIKACGDHGVRCTRQHRAPTRAEHVEFRVSLRRQSRNVL